MGMGIKENEIVVAKMIANDSKEVRPLAIRVKDFEVRSITKDEAEVALERLHNKGVVKSYEPCFGFFTKKKGGKMTAFEKTGQEKQFDDGEQGGREERVFYIDFSPTQLTEYLESTRFSAPVMRLIERRGEDFELNNETLKFTDKNSIHYKLFLILYGDDGGSKTLSYAKINSELVRLGEEKIDEQEKMIRRIKNAVNNGLYLRVGEKLKPYVKIKARQGVSLINPVR
jgi:hypothetical protein